MNSKEIGQIIRQQRKKVGVTQQEAAGLCGVGITFLSKVERGHEAAEIGKVLHVMKSLGLNFKVEGLRE